MDPLLLEALRFGVAILAGGIVAVISAVLAFRYSERQRRDDALLRDAAVRRALIAEIRENMRRLRGPDVELVPDAPIVRGAWDQARALPLADDVFEAVSAAYVLGDETNRDVDLLRARATRSGIVADRAMELSAVMAAQERIVRKATDAYAAFGDALEVLGAATADSTSMQEGTS